jgi:hypothetical protein
LKTKQFFTTVFLHISFYVSSGKNEKQKDRKMSQDSCFSSQDSCLDPISIFNGLRLDPFRKEYVIPPVFIYEAPIDVGEYKSSDDSQSKEAIQWGICGKRNHDIYREAMLTGKKYLTYAIDFCYRDRNWGWDNSGGIFLHLNDENNESVYFSSGRSAGVFTRENLKESMKKLIWQEVQKNVQYTQKLNEEAKEQKEQNETVVEEEGTSVLTPYDNPFDTVGIWEQYSEDPRSVNTGQPDGDLIAWYSISYAQSSEHNFVVTLTPPPQATNNFFGEGVVILTSVLF